MKKNIFKTVKTMAVIAAAGTIISSMALTATASTTDSLASINVGAATVLNMSAESDSEETEKTDKTEKSDKADEKEEIKEVEKTSDESEDDKNITDSKNTTDSRSTSSGRTSSEDSQDSDLVMANVKDLVNIRKEPSEESDKVGKLYRDCGGEIIERSNGWTKIVSGNVRGWVKDEFLLFGEEAEKAAKEAGNYIAKVTTGSLRVRKEANEDSSVLGLLAKGEELTALEIINNGWVKVEYDGEAGYISGDYVEVRFEVDHGESMDEIKKREEKEAEERRAEEKKAAERREAESRSSSSESKTVEKKETEAAPSDAKLLGALIQCEAGNQSYEGQVAVGAVVMNRVKSGGYPGTISGVIYASGQFTPARNGRLASVLSRGVNDSCMRAAAEAMSGVSNVGNATHFRRAGSHDGQVIGDHVFW